MRRKGGWKTLSVEDKIDAILTDLDTLFDEITALQAKVSRVVADVEKIKLKVPL